MAEEKLCCKEAILEAVSGGAEQVMDLYLCEKNWIKLAIHKLGSYICLCNSFSIFVFSLLECVAVQLDLVYT